MDPDNHSTSVETVSQLAVPTDGWQGLIQAFGITDGASRMLKSSATLSQEHGLPRLIKVRECLREAWY